MTLPPDRRRRPGLLELVSLPVGFLAGGRPPISKRAVLYLLAVLLLVAGAMGWLAQP
ncbi:MAG: hypothetical protein ACOCSD_00825 [Halolamina sp.]